MVEILKFGAFVRFGPLDGLLHISQVLDDRVDIDENNQRLVGKESGRSLSVGDRVRARIVSIDLNDNNKNVLHLYLQYKKDDKDFSNLDDLKQGELYDYNEFSFFSFLPL